MKILIIDDEPQIRIAVKAGLERNNYETILASSGTEGLNLAATYLPDIIILDIAMPGKDGFAVTRELRTWSKIPIIILSVRDDERDKIKALDLGADDYLVKPFGIGELLARIRAVLRRNLNDTNLTTAVIKYKNLSIDKANRLVKINDTIIHLTPKEYDLLNYMAVNQGKVLTHTQLLTKIWGAEFANDSHTLRVHIANLRNKIEANPQRPEFIKTETRVGYRFMNLDTID